MKRPLYNYRPTRSLGDLQLTMVISLLLNGMILQVGAHLSHKLRTIAAVEVSTGRSDAAADAAAAWRMGWVEVVIPVILIP